MAVGRSCDARKMRNRIGDGYKTGWKGSGMRSDSLRQHRIILSADTASEVRQMPSQKRR